MSAKLELAEYVSALRFELQRAERLDNDARVQFSVDSIQLELEIASTSEAVLGGGIRFWVVSLDASAKETQVATQRLTLTLTPIANDGSRLLINDSLNEVPD